MADVSPIALGRDRWGRFFTTQVWTWHGLATYYTVFVIDLASRRIQVLGSTPHPTDLFMGQMVCLVNGGGGWRVDRTACADLRWDRKWSRAVRQRQGEAGIRVVLTPARAPSANAYAERFVRSIKEECLHQVIPIGERHFRRTIAESSSTTIWNAITMDSITD